MKKHIFFLLVLAFSLYSSAQPTTPEAPSVKTDYLKKSKNQNTAAWILVGGGAALVMSGAVVGTREVIVDIGNIITPEDEKSSNTGEILIWTGLASIVGSIPLFIAASRNKRKAEQFSTSFKIQTLLFIEQTNMVRKPYPSVSLTIKL